MKRKIRVGGFVCVDRRGRRLGLSAVVGLFKGFRGVWTTAVVVLLCEG